MPLLIWWVGLTVIIMQVSVQIGLNWNWPTGTELGNIQFNTIWYYPGGATAYLGGTTAYLVGVEIIRIKAKSVQLGWDLNWD